MKNKYIIPIILTLFVLVFAGTSALADNGNNKNKNINSENSAIASVSTNCPPGHLRAPGWLKNMFRKGNRVPCTPDTVSPTISNVTVSNVTDRSAMITWDTNEVSSSKVHYGTDSSYGNTESGNWWKNWWGQGLTTHHAVMIYGLSADTTYHFRALSSDRAGNTVKSDDMTFKTLASQPSDDNDPVISNITVTNITATGAKISWDTDELTRSRISYGTTDSYGLSISDTELRLHHEMTLPGLSGGTTYHYQIRARDMDSNTTFSSDSTFKTSATDTTGPVISGIAVASITDTSAVISWNTDESATTRVNYGTSDSYGTTVSSSVLSTSHQVTLVGLAPLTVYHYQVVSVDASLNSTSSSDRMFTTLSSPADVTAPIISSISTDDLTGTSVNINWTTNEMATSKVYYGTLNPVVILSASNVSDSTLRTNHTITLNGLSTGTIYYYVIESKDGSGNTSLSGQLSITTES